MSNAWSLRRRSSALLLAWLAPLVASAQLAVGVERPLAAPDLETLARTGRVAVASNGSIMLAAWIDRRTDRGAELVAGRIDAGGRLLDTRGIPLSSTPGVDEDHPFVEFDGIATFVVVWASGGNTMAARLDDRGTIASGPVVLAEGRPEALTINNRDLLVAIADGGGTNVSLLRSDLGLRQVVRLARVQDVEIAALGNGFAIVWTEREASGQSIVRVMRLDRDRRIIDATTVAELGRFDPPVTFAVATDVNDAIIAAGGENRMAIVRMVPDGTVTTIATNTTTAQRSIEDVVPRSDGFDVLAILDRRAHVFRYTGNALTAEVSPVEGTAGSGAGTRTGNVYTVWQADGAVVGRFAFAAQQEPAVPLSRSPASQQQPVLASDGTAALAVWTEDMNETTERVMARLLALDGTPDAATRALTLATRTMTPMQSPPAMALGNDYFIAWIDQRSGPTKAAHLMTRNVTRRGALGSTSQIATTAHPTDRPALAGGPNDTLLVWSDGLGNARHLRGVFLSQPQASFAIPDLVAEPAAVYGENGYVVMGVTSYGAVLGTFVANDGTTRPLFETQPPFGAADSEPAIAWSPRGNYLVVFRRDDAIYARLLRRDGAAVGPNLALVTGGINDNPRVTWDGHAFVVAWTSRASADALADGDTHVMRVLLNGTPQTPVALSATTRNDDHVALASLGDGNVLAAYQRMAGELQNVHRVFTRVVTGAAIPVTPGKRRSVR